MKFFVTGVNGQLGHDVMNELSSRSYEGIGSDIAPKYSGIQDDSPVTKMPYISLDITDKEAVTRILKETAPDVVVHCAAWTAVDLAEDADEQETVRKINAAGTQYIASACKELDCKMIYLSTDYVFDGQGTTPWKPDCKDYKPLNVYGQTKLLGEQAVANTLEKYFIVRIAWVFGQYGYYHATNEGGYISWYDFTKEIFRQAVALGHTEYDENHVTVFPVTTAEYGMSKAARPFNSRLDKSKLVEAGFTPLPDWKDALQRYLKEVLQ